MSEESRFDPASSNWKRPNEVMRHHQLKQKKKALQARMNKTESSAKTTPSNFNLSLDSLKASNGPLKRSNPFRCPLGKQFKKDTEETFNSTILDSSSDNTLFHLLSLDNESKNGKESLQTSFKSVLSQLSNKVEVEEEAKVSGSPLIPIDWTLKSKMRFISPKPFAWNQKLKTCEEASGITGFVRCLETGPTQENADSVSSCSLDTSPNAHFHQCCLYWQHPVLPWLELFPRGGGRVGHAAPNAMATDPRVRDCLHKDWIDSFRSLFQLVRANQCPYFYLCSNNFTCLFRAAGICGQSELHALLTPTTRGFRHALKAEDIEFSMPLKKGGRTSKRLSDGTNDTGYSTKDSMEDDSRSRSLSNTGEEPENQEDEAEDEDMNDDWLESLGVTAEEIKRLNTKQAKRVHDKEREVDRTPESLVYVTGVEAQGLFNFLMDCKSRVAVTGPLTGVPPTLLAPVAFQGATLRPLKVRQSLMKAEEGRQYHSMELRGPIMPHTVHHLCGLLQRSLDKFSVTFACVESTRPLSQASQQLLNPLAPTGNEGMPSPGATPSAFGRENLSDCGLQSSMLQDLCSADPARAQAVDSIRYSTDYTWT